MAFLNDVIDNAELSTNQQMYGSKEDCPYVEQYWGNSQASGSITYGV